MDVCKEEHTVWLLGYPRWVILSYGGHNEADDTERAQPWNKNKSRAEAMLRRMTPVPRALQLRRMLRLACPSPPRRMSFKDLRRSRLSGWNAARRCRTMLDISAVRYSMRTEQCWTSQAIHDALIILADGRFTAVFVQMRSPVAYSPSKSFFLCNLGYKFFFCVKFPALPGASSYYNNASGVHRRCAAGPANS